jgi:hypothetical protein
MTKCSIDKCCIEHHEAIAHLSNQEIEELYKKYKRGMKNADLVSEYNIKIPKVNGLITVLPKLCLVDCLCPKCGTSMHRKRDYKDKSYRNFPATCLNCDYSMPVVQGKNKRGASTQQSKRSNLQPANHLLIQAKWQPSRDGLHRLHQHGIPDSYSLSKLDEFISQARKNGDNRNDWNTQFFRFIKKHWAYSQTDAHRKQRLAEKARRGKAVSITQQWLPSSDAQQILQRAGIDAQFIQDSIPEFVLYWQERGNAHNTWNTKFIQHIRQQWARYSSSLEHSSVPTRISDDWQPDNNCYNILAMANIDIHYAQELIGEFVLYWRDSNQLQTSWNSKYLQYVKQQWARSSSPREQPSTPQHEHIEIVNWTPSEEVINSLVKSEIPDEFFSGRIPFFIKYANKNEIKDKELDERYLSYVKYGYKLEQDNVKNKKDSFTQISSAEKEIIQKRKNSVFQVLVPSNKSDIQSLAEKLEGIIVPTGSLSDGCVVDIELNTSLGMIDANSVSFKIISGTKYGLELESYCEETKRKKSLFLPHNSIAAVLVSN